MCKSQVTCHFLAVAIHCSCFSDAYASFQQTCSVLRQQESQTLQLPRTEVACSVHLKQNPTGNCCLKSAAVGKCIKRSYRSHVYTQGSMLPPPFPHRMLTSQGSHDHGCRLRGSLGPGVSHSQQTSRGDGAQVIAQGGVAGHKQTPEEPSHNNSHRLVGFNKYRLQCSLPKRGDR
jgi:hypothetical protein